MRKLLSTTLSKTGGLLKYLSRKISISSNNNAKGLFLSEIGSSTDKLSFLDEGSVVFDVGGYEGQWASDIYGMYNCNIHIFEPVPHFATKIKERFKKNQKIIVNSFGLSDKTHSASINLSADGSSTVRRIGDQVVNIELVDIVDYITRNNISKIDLVKINIEGGEYSLLKRLINTGYTKIIDSILVQFHNFFPEATSEMTEIKNQLKNSYRPIYQFEFIWELWRKK
jgi:FkbM family methyltransferase